MKSVNLSTDVIWNQHGSSTNRTTNIVPPQTSQFFWYLGHVSTVVNVVLYQFFALFSASASAKYYNYALLSVVTTYSIVLFQMLRSSKTSMFNARNLTSNDNFQYLMLAIVWYMVSSSKVISGGLYPFIIYSSFHAANYFKNYLLPILPNVAATTKDRYSTVISHMITHYNEQSLMVATNCEIFVLVQLGLGAPFISYYLITDFWLAIVNVIVLVQYACFIKLRYRQSKHTKMLFDGSVYKMDAMMNSGRVPGAIVNYYYQAKQQLIVLVNTLPV